ncbi:MAG TPA: 3-(cis-5,6-dihydroxycyclohexa-1,3-dien-1-yl)propanoate dehydrogenase [Patescibacteria group bacterium]|nr:3-(cis-5,6-dihydroxycyclohexa-1,3-dien-1-yl)propanoate dehydrogenase [Patescibacteria group bacterium]
MGWLDNKVALVTGGASGLGRAIVERFVEEGARVAILDRARERSEELAKQLGERGAAIVGEVTVLADNQRAVAETVRRFGRLDCFVGNAGIWDFSTSLAALPEDRIDAAFDELFGVNVKGYLLGAKAAFRELAKTRGSIVFTVSNAGFYPCGGGPLYTASKHAVVGLIRQLAYELAPKIRVNGVAPGAIPTDLRGPRSLDMGEQSIAGVPLKAAVERGVPLGKLPEPRDYTGSYVLLASAENSSTATGGVILCEGGIGIRGFVDAAGGRDL